MDKEVIAMLLNMLLIITIFLLLNGCSSGGGENNDNNPLVEKIKDWQVREQLLQDPQLFHGTSLWIENIDDLYEELSCMLAHYTPITPTNEMPGKDHWQTSDETAASMRGDCEDITAYWYEKVRAAQFVSDNDVFMRVAGPTVNGVLHAYLVVRFDDEELFINNGALSRIEPDLPLILEYDLWSVFVM